jgi:hypothetical protein
MNALGKVKVKTKNMNRVILKEKLKQINGLGKFL